MKRTRKYLIWLLILILLILISEIVFRPRALNSSLAKMLYKHERYEDAAKLFERYKDDGESAANLGKSRYKQGKYAEAEQGFDETLKKSPDDASLYYDKGNAAFKENDYQSAVENFEQALLLDPSDDDARANLELALRKREENPPSSDQQQKPEEEKRDEEEVRNLLEALDNLEARDRKNQRQPNVPRTDNWW